MYMLLKVMTENYILNKEQEIFSKLKLLEKDLTYFIESEIQGELGESLYELLKNENFDIEDLRIIFARKKINEKIINLVFDSIKNKD